MQDARRERMTQPYPVISSGASCHREAERGTPIITASPLLPQHLLGSSGGPNRCRVTSVTCKRGEMSRLNLVWLQQGGSVYGASACVQ